MKKLNNIDLYKLRVLAILGVPNTKYSNIWHLAHQTPKKLPQHMFQILKLLAWVNSTIHKL